MGRSFTLQHAAARPFCRTRDLAVSRWHLRSDELLGRVAHARDRSATRSRRAAATGLAARVEAGFLVDDGRCRARFSRSLRVDTLVVGTALRSCGNRHLDVRNDLAAARDRVAAGVLLTRATRDANRSVERAAIRVE